MKQSEYLEFAKDIATHAGEIMLKFFGQDNITKSKGDKSPVTIADTEINSYVIKRVKDTYPAHAVLGEEESFGESAYVWVCDPIDGTAQFSRGVPISVFSLALVIDGISTIGVIYDPFFKNMYWAIKGRGAYKNDKQIFVNNDKFDPSNQHSTSIAFGFFPRAKWFDLSTAYKKFVELANLYCIGSTTHDAAMLAEGHHVAVIFPAIDYPPHDMAAAKVIVEEAGGIVRNFDGNEDRMDGKINGCILTNKVVYNDVLRIIKAKS